MKCVFPQRSSSQHYVIALDMHFLIAKNEQANKGEEVLVIPLPLLMEKLENINVKRLLKIPKLMKMFRICVKICNIDIWIHI